MIRWRGRLMTPRSRVGDIMLFDGAGNVVAQLLKVRFRTMPRAVPETKDSLSYRTTFLRLHQSGQPSAPDSTPIRPKKGPSAAASQASM